MTPREQKLLATNYTPAVLDKMRKDWAPGALASALDIRVREIEDINDTTFLELGMICVEFERNPRELWRELGFARWTSWMNARNSKSSRAKRYAARAAFLAVAEINIPMEEATKIKSRANASTLAKVSRQHRGKLMEAAKTMENEEFIKKIRQELPDELIESNAPMRFKPTESQRKVIDTGIEAAILLEELSTREEVLEMWAADYLERNQRKLEKAMAANA